MSTLEIEQQDIEAPETGLIRRKFAGTVTAGDGRTVDVLVVPFGETITHNDGLGGVPVGVDYQEEWMPGCFRHQTAAADKVLGNYEHMQGPRGLVARGQSLTEQTKGYVASFRMLEGPDSDKTLELIREGVLDGVSLEARPRTNHRSATGVIQRVKADLVAVAFTRFGAYAGAKVLAVREEAATTLDAALLPVEIDPELIERCRRLGIRIPQRYEAHPAEGTPEDPGTPEDGTRQPNHNSSEET